MPTTRSMATASSLLDSKADNMASPLTLSSTLLMRSGCRIPMLGFGVYQTPAASATALVKHAVSVGYTHVDSAAAYRNEEASARGLVDSKVPRSQLFFTSKLSPRNRGYNDTKKSIQNTLREVEKAGLEYIDLYLIHAPYGGKKNRLGEWKAMVEAQQRGEIKSLGVSNYGVHHLEELEAYIKEVESTEGHGKGGTLDVNQVEIHPWLPREDIVAWCKDHNVVVEAYSPLARGQKLNDPVLLDIAKKHSKSAAQVLVRWSLQMGFVPLPKSEKNERISSNAEVYDFELDADDMQKLHFPKSYFTSGWDPTVSDD